MVQRCAGCGFAADTTATLPEPWVAYLGSESRSSRHDDEVTVPVCRGCQETIERLLDPRHPSGGVDPDPAVRAFLDQLEHPPE